MLRDEGRRPERAGMRWRASCRRWTNRATHCEDMRESQRSSQGKSRDDTHSATSCCSTVVVEAGLSSGGDLGMRSKYLTRTLQSQKAKTVRSVCTRTYCRSRSSS